MRWPRFFLPWRRPKPSAMGFQDDPEWKAMYCLELVRLGLEPPTALLHWLAFHAADTVVADVVKGFTINYQDGTIVERSPGLSPHAYRTLYDESWKRQLSTISERRLARPPMFPVTTTWR